MAELQEGLTFDDVLLVPNHSDVMPADANLSSRFSANVPINLPISSSAMDTVTEYRLAIAIAQEGGIGIIHKSMSLEDEERFFVDSRALMLILCLVSSELPTHDQKEDYISKLKFKAESTEDKMLTKELFVKVSQPLSVW